MTDESFIAFSGTVAEIYDLCIVPFVMERSAADLAERVPLKFPMVELASGTGVLSSALVKKFGAADRLLATDVSADMIAIANSKRPDARISHEIADMEALPFSDASFQTAVCQYGIMFTDPPTAFQEIHRVLVPGGSFAFNVWGSHAENAWAALASKEVGEFFGEGPVQYFDMPFWYHDRNRIERDLSGAGFGNISCEVVRWEATCPEAGIMARMMVEGNTGCGARAAETKTTQALEDRLEKAFEREFGNHPMRCQVQAIIVTATS